MTEDEIRAIVRETLARLDASAPAIPSQLPTAPSAMSAPGQPLPAPLWRAHPSFGKFLAERSGTDEGMCLIEPAVRCNQCGYCQCLGY